MLTIHSFWFVLYLGLGNKFCLGNNGLPEINTPLGKVQGFWKVSLDGRRYAAFEGIPYAKPPIDDLRFEEPQPVTPWNGIWEANIRRTCIQNGVFGAKTISGEEDCLYLNVYVSSVSEGNSKSLDVVVYIHAGGFVSGSGLSMDSKVLMDRDIVLVSMNYRLSFFGFLSTEDDVIPGNNGMKDQVLALKWVRDNIEAFGGNPRSVTLAGASSGGISVHLHYLSPLSRGLFDRGLSHSGGSALTPWGFKRNPLENAKKLSVLAGCPDKPSGKLKKCLKQKPAEDLLKLLEHFDSFSGMPFTFFAPTVEKGSRKPFLDREPYLQLKEGNVLDVPWITSFAADEGLLPSAYFWLQLDNVDEKWNDIASYFLHYNDTISEARRNLVPREILDYYLGPGERINANNFKKFTKMLTDRLYGAPTEIAAKMQARVTKSPVYFYFFNYQEGDNKAVNFYSGGKILEGVGHGDDNIYFYGLFLEKPFSEKDSHMRNMCQDMLYSFASTGKASFDGTDDWQPTGFTELTYLNVTGPDDMKLRKTKQLTHGDFWSGIGFLENEHVTVKDEL